PNEAAAVAKSAPESSPLRGEGRERGETEAPFATPDAEAADPHPGPLPGGEREKKILASPAVRARAKSLGIDLAQVKSAQGDRVRHADLDAFLTYNQGY